MYGAVGANTNSSYGKMYRRMTKIALTLSKAMEEQFTHLICLTYQGKQNCSVVSTNNQCMEQLERFFLCQNVWAAQQNYISLNHPNF